MDVLVQGLADRMEQDPDNVEGWIMLGRSYLALQAPGKALGALERAYKLAPDQADVMVAYAEVLAVNSGNKLEGRPAELIRAALEREPENPSARWLTGMLAYQQERFAEAASTWQGLLDELDPAGQEAEEMRQMVAEARSRAGASAGPEAAPADGPPPPATHEIAQTPPSSEQAPEAAEVAGARIQVSVSLAPELSARTSPDDTVFVYARAAAGPPMPLAARRIKVSDLPANLTLDDGMAMVPAMRLSAFPEVVVGARVSKSGQASPQPGDLEGQSGPVSAAEAPAVSVAIDRIRP
jgi:cytochrome c-type biogenesis protein CcmH